MTKDAEEFEFIVKKARANQIPQDIINVIPYGSFIGISAEILDGNVLYTLDKKKSNIGNPSLPAIPGGVVGRFVELASAIESIYLLDIIAVPKVVDFSIDYLRPGRFKKMYARCSVLRQGRKLINVSSTAWQDDINKPTATARCNFLVP